MRPALREAFEDELTKLAVPSPGALSRAGASLANFGRRTVHGLTGALASDAAGAARIGLDPQLYAKGITSIPGVVRGLAQRPTETAKALGHAALGGGGKLNTALAAAPLVLAAPDLARGDESAVGGRSMRQKVVGLGANTALGVATAGLPFGANLLTAPVSMAAEHALSSAVGSRHA